MAVTLRRFFPLILLVLIYLQKVSSERKYAVLTAKSLIEEENICIVYYTNFSILAEEKSKEDYFPLKDHSDKDFCFSYDLNLKNEIVILSNSNNCSSDTQVLFLQNNGAVAALFMTSGQNMSLSLNTSLAKNINITVGLIHSDSVKNLRKWSGNITACMFSPDGFRFDLSLLIIWIICLFTLYVGCYWSGIVRFNLYSKEIQRKTAADIQNCLERSENETQAIQAVETNKTSEESALNISVLAVAVFVICMTVTLLLMYYFYDYMVYFLIFLFVVASIQSIYAGLYPFVITFFPRFTPIECNCFHKLFKFEYQTFFLLAISMVLPIFWACIRKEMYAWVFQDILAVFFCINLLKSLRLPSLKICSVLLILLFFYDIFFVFITPLFTVRGESVMEKVARGGQSNETFPMTVSIPHITFDPLTVCFQKSSPTILGLGDIIVPGLLIAFCHGFDLVSNSYRIYFYSTLIAYGIGLILTYVALYLMTTAQPALLYLVPCTLLTVVIIGFKRGELILLWKGFPHLAKLSVNSTSNQIYPSNDIPRPEVLSENSDITSTKDLNDTEINSSQQTSPTFVSSETKQLL